jgi:prolyl 4-hydroxylase
MIKIISLSIIIVVLILCLISYNYISPFKNESNFKNNLDYYDENNFYFEIENVLTNEECDLLINDSKDKLEQSKVMSVDKNGDALNKVDKNSRTSWQTWLPKYKYKQITNNITNLVNKYLKNKINSAQFEDIQVARYKPGQEYKHHYDICDPDNAYSEHLEHCKADYKKFNSVRYITIILYLNDGFNGGETRFTKLNKNIKPKKGKALIFFNCNLNDETDKTGKCNMIINSEHSGMPVDNPNKKNQIDEKWIANIWIRTKNT